MTLEILDQTILGNTLLQWITAVAALIITVLVLRMMQHFGGRRLAALASQTDTYWDDAIAGAIAKTKLLFLLVAGVFVGTYFLQFTERVQSIISTVFMIALLIQIGIWGVAIITIALESSRKRALEKDPAAVTTINVIALGSKIVLWSTVLLLGLDNLGVNVTALIAGLGIGGIAVALALQNILGDLFASLSIVFDKPFVNKDFVIIGEMMGSVEHIGLKTTRIRSLSGEQLIFSNSDLLSSRIRNYGRMFERRVVFSLGVTYQTPREKLKQIPTIVKEAVEEQDKTRFDRAHFMKYGDYALLFEAVYYVLSPDYNNYMDIQQSIYFDIHERFEQEEIEFAYPTQTLFVSQTDENSGE